MDSLAKALCKAKGNMSIRACAGEIEISPTTLSRAMAGHVPDQKTLGKICRWLGVDPEQFTQLGTLMAIKPRVKLTYKSLTEHIIKANQKWIDEKRY